MLKELDVVDETYECVRFLGGGNSGECWEVRHLRLPVSCAIKLQHEEDVDSEHRTSRFSAEQRTLFRLDHPNLVRVRDARRTRTGQLYTVMDLIDGETLTVRLGGGRMHPLRALKIAYDVACGLREAHENGVIHRDVKPDNVMVTEAGRAVVLDFSAAKFLREGLRTTQPPDQVATLAYMAPEQLEGTADARGDVYSLGMVMYRALSGEHPYQKSFGNNPRLMKDQFETRPPPFAARVGLPRWIDDLVLKALEKPIDLRWQTMAVFMREIHAAMRRLAAEIQEGRVVVDVPLGDPPIDLESEAPAGARRQYEAPAALPQETTGPVLPSERITLAPGTVPGQDAEDTAATVPLRPPAAPGATAPLPASTSKAPVAPVTTTVRLPRPERARAWIAAAAVLLAVPASVGIVRRWRSVREISLRVSAPQIPAWPASPASVEPTSEPLPATVVTPPSAVASSPPPEAPPPAPSVRIAVPPAVPKTPAATPPAVPKTPSAPPPAAPQTTAAPPTAAPQTTAAPAPPAAPSASNHRIFGSED